MKEIATKFVIWFFWLAVFLLSPVVVILSALTFSLTLGYYYARQEVLQADKVVQDEEDLANLIKRGKFN